MRCDDVQLALSARLDGVRVDGPPVDRHVEGCGTCRTFLTTASRVRRELRFAPVDDVPDVTAAVLRTVAERSARPEPWRPRWGAAVPLVASLVIGTLVGGLLAAPQREPAVAAELGDLVLAAQHAVSAFEADLTIEEHGWHPEVPLRRYEGSIRYASPEQLSIEIHDRTTYPAAGWVRNDVTRVVSHDAEWSSAVPACPRAQLPGCLPDQARTTGATERLPLSGLGAAALDAVVPVASLRLGGGTGLGTRERAAGQQVGVEADVAQLRPLLDALFGAGTWRELHPTDPVTLWVDATTLTPREVTVRAAGGQLRDRWAAERGLTDTEGDLLVDVRFDVRDAADGLTMPAPPGQLPSAAFVDRSVDIPLPTVLPDGMTRHRSGIQVTTERDIAIVTWTDGRAWLRLRAVEGWPGGRLFGDLGSLVRRVTLVDGRILYASSDGQAAAIHADQLDLVLEGSLDPETLLEVAASIPVHGLRVPADWAEAADADLADAARALPTLLVPRDLDGFGSPAVQVADGRVVIGYAGSGGRELVLTQRTGDAVSPPVAPDVIGVDVRGVPGRYLPHAGELEWVEDGKVVSLRSDDLGLADLLEIAADVQAAP